MAKTVQKKMIVTDQSFSFLKSISIMHRRWVSKPGDNNFGDIMSHALKSMDGGSVTLIIMTMTKVCFGPQVSKPTGDALLI